MPSGVLSLSVSGMFGSRRNMALSSESQSRSASESTRVTSVVEVPVSKRSVRPSKSLSAVPGLRLHQSERAEAPESMPFTRKFSTESLRPAGASSVHTMRKRFRPAGSQGVQTCHVAPPAGMAEANVEITASSQ